MTVDDTFRWIFVAIRFVVLPFALYHRIRSNMTGEKLDRWQEGAFILFGLRLSGLPWFIGGIVWMIDPTLMAWASVPIPLWVRWCGFVLIAIWGALFVWTFQTLRRNLTANAEEIARARQGDWSILLTSTRPVPRSWFPADLSGVSILCLASGGGQQGPILAATGAIATRASKP